MSNKITIYLMRHGETILNKAKRTQGWCDGVLTKKGTENVINAGLGLSNVKFDAVYSSDLGRAVKTAEIVLNENNASDNVQLVKCEGLREVYFGKYEGGLDYDFYSDLLNYLNLKSFEDLHKQTNPQEMFCNACAALDETGEAEDYNTSLKRALDSINSICKKESNENTSRNVLIVTHGGIMRLILDYFNKNNLEIDKIDNASISKLEYYNGEFKILSINDNSYTEQGKAIRMI